MHCCYSSSCRDTTWWSGVISSIFTYNGCKALNLSTVKALIAYCNKVIIFLDNIEEFRPLSWPEFNFRRIVKLQLEDILHWQFIYCKQHCTIRNIKVGEENSKFFHAMATERFRRNNISSIKSVDVEVISDHEQIAGIFWSDFNQRMGQAKGIQMVLTWTH